MNTTSVPIGRQAATLRCTDGIRPRGRVIRTDISPRKRARASGELDRKGWATSKASSAASRLSSANHRLSNYRRRQRGNSAFPG
jgi:hypothetical protein